MAGAVGPGQSFFVYFSMSTLREELEQLITESLEAIKLRLAQWPELSRFLTFYTEKIISSDKPDLKALELISKIQVSAYDEVKQAMHILELVNRLNTNAQESEFEKLKRYIDSLFGKLEV